MNFVTSRPYIISWNLTYRCNLACEHCYLDAGAPARLEQAHNFSDRSELNTEDCFSIVDQIAEFAPESLLILTGGEPLLRRDILEIIRCLKQIETVKDLSITTNGSRLAPLLVGANGRSPLREAGLYRINISLDSMDPVRFKEVTLSNTYHQVLEAVFLALEAGFPVKLNMVVLKGLTRQEIIEFVRLACEYPLEVRFLEFMPLCGTGWRPDLVVPIGDVRTIVFENFELEELPRGDNVAQAFVIKGGKGRIGFIASLTESFCNRCSRIRLTADGKIRPCLFSDKEVSIKELLRNQAPDEELIAAIRYAAKIKPKGNWFSEKPFRADDENFAAMASNPMIRSIGG